MATVKVIQPEPPIETEVLAEAIYKLGESAKKLEQSGLKRESLVLLLHASSGVGKTDVRAVLYALTSLQQSYLTPEFLKKKQNGTERA